MGAIITDIDLSNGIQADETAKLRDIWLKYQVIIIRGQKLTPARQIEIARAFGEPDYYPFLKGLEDHPRSPLFSNARMKPIILAAFGIQIPFINPAPPMATMLYALELPPVGGDTLFANQYLAYEQLPKE